LLNSRANSTAKKYINEIKKFFVWCRSRQISVQIPFSAPVVALYLFNLDQQLRSPASMVLVHASLKWLHSFTPDDGPNPLDNACCRSMIECAKRTRSLPVSKKKPVDADAVKSIIDRFGAEGALLKDLTCL
jgi:site-specific recombinase XerD